jgi:hypothetical protein
MFVAVLRVFVIVFFASLKEEHVEPLCFAWIAHDAVCA